MVGISGAEDCSRGRQRPRGSAANTQARLNRMWSGGYVTSKTPHAV
jgi:hypothetical protein